MFTLPSKEFRQGLKGQTKPINFSLIPQPNTVNISLLVPQAKGVKSGAGATFEIPWHVSINYH